MQRSDTNRATAFEESGPQTARELTPSTGEKGLRLRELRRAQADSLHRSLPGKLVGTAALCGLFAIVFKETGSGFYLAVWIGLGVAAFLLRLYLFFAYREGLRGDDLKQATRFLWSCTAASALSGLMFAWAWLVFAPSLSRNEFAGLAYANIAVLFAGLYAYGVFMPAFLALLLTSIPAAVIAVYWHHRPSDEWLISTLGLLVVGVVSLLYASRGAITFSTNLALQNRVFRLLEEVTSKRDEALRATLAKSRFLASASHDLRQPMHAINLYLRALDSSFQSHLAAPDDAQPVEAMRGSIASLREGTIYLNSMFESLLDVSRLDAGTIPFEIRYCSVRRLFVQLEKEFSELAHAEGLSFKVRLPSNFEQMEVLTDPVLLERLLRNLLSNAFRYTETGGVRLSAVSKDGHIDFRVVDTGPGIPEDLRLRVLEEFFQVPGTLVRSTRSGGGMGLGLSIAARLAEKLNSRLRVNSHVGLGSVFALRQPMQRAFTTSVGESEPKESRPAPFSAQTLIAIIDDDPGIRRSSRLMLESLGASVFTAESGEVAVQQLGIEGKEPQLILCDYRLEGSNGIETIARLREEFNRDIPAILITGETSAHEMAAFRQSELRVLYKPLSGDQLLTAIRQELTSVSQLSPGSPDAGPPTGPGFDSPPQAP